MAGISCASHLQRHGLSPVVFDKGRGLGGRLATRRLTDGTSFDHGAQYITARSPGFAGLLDALRASGAAASWAPKISGATQRSGDTWQVGIPGMSSLLRPLADTLDWRREHAISALQRTAGGWRLHCASMSLDDTFDVVISTVPAPQARPLLAHEPRMQQALDAVTMAPCWSLMLAWDTSPGLDFDARRFDSGAVAWMARQGSRPGRDRATEAAAEAWVVHASPAWSSRHLEAAPAEVTSALLGELGQLLGQRMPMPELALAHRWRYAMTCDALGQPFLASADGRLFAGGDWCLGARVECAYTSGTAIAEAVLGQWLA